MSNDIKSSPAGRAAALAALHWYAGRGRSEREAGEGGGPPSTLAQIVPLVRARLKLENAITDQMVVAALDAIARCSDQRGRWMTAFNSDLGRALATGGRDLNTALRVLVALAPEVRS